jgi:predicted dehydrogenase
MMTRRWAVAALILSAAALGARAAAPSLQEKPAVSDVRFMTLDPGHFHASLVQKEMYPGVSKRVSVFAPLGPDLLGHLQRITAFNTRRDEPTAWEMDIHTGPDFLDRMLRTKPGNVVVISGRNRGKIDRILASVRANLHVLADKPWILEASDLPKLEAALAEADARGVVAYDIMTERFESTTMLQRELVNDPAVFGERTPGTRDEPAVYMESVHHLMKVVAGAPNIRPTWFFDTNEQGEGLNDIGTHLVDLVQWTLFPDQPVAAAGVRVLAAQRWPTRITEEQFRRVTGAPGFPESLASRVNGGVLDYDCNTLVSYTVGGVHAKLNIIWDWEAPAGAGDTHFAVYRGGRARIEARQSKADGYRPELYVVPNRPGDKAAILSAARSRLRARYPDVGVEDRGAEILVSIPDKYRVGHEAHFAEVTRHFLEYVRDRSRLPGWERPDMVAKYTVTTRGTQLSREAPAKVAPRLAP